MKYARISRSVVYLAVAVIFSISTAALAGLPNPGMEIDPQHTALVITDPQNDFLSPKDLTWGIVGESVTENNTVKNIETLFKVAEKKGTYAADQEYNPKAKTTSLVETPLAGVKRKTVIIKHFEFPPGFIGGKHFHHGPVFVYVLEGKLTIDTESAGRQTINPGEIYQEPIGRAMQARNISTTEVTKIIVFQVGDEGKPMMIKVE